MESPIRAASEFTRSSLALGRRSLEPASWILATLAAVELIRASCSEIVARKAVDLASTLDVLAPVAGAGLALLLAVVVGTGTLLLLPLQDSLARGRRASAAEAVRMVLHRVGALAWSSVFQTTILLVPPLILAVLLLVPPLRAAIEAPGELDPDAYRAITTAVTRAVLGPTAYWVALMNAFLLFATPLLLLENRGPLRSLWISARLFARHAVRDWSRFVAFGLLWLLLAGLVIAGRRTINAAVAFLPPGPSAVRIFAPALWSAASTVLAMPFGTAGLLVLFRRMVPAKP